jgi:hypothetical protein
MDVPARPRPGSWRLLAADLHGTVALHDEVSPDSNVV